MYEIRREERAVIITNLICFLELLERPCVCGCAVLHRPLYPGRSRSGTTLIPARCKDAGRDNAAEESQEASKRAV